MKKLHRLGFVLLLALAIAAPAAAHNKIMAAAPAFDLRDEIAAQTPLQPLPVFAGTNAFDEVAHLELPQPSIADELAHRFADLDVESPSDLAIFDRTVSRKLASGPLGVFEENNVNEPRELSLELRRTIGNVRNRWYDPGTGTFLTPDPMGYQDSSNLYAFCAGDPVNCSDPTGEWGLKDGWNQVKENTVFTAGLFVGAAETVIDAVNNLNPVVGTVNRVRAAIPRAKRVAAAYRADGTGAAASQYGAEVKDYVLHNAPIIGTIVNGQGIADTYYREGAVAAGRYAGGTWVAVTGDALAIYAGGRAVQARSVAPAPAPESVPSVVPAGYIGPERQLPSAGTFSGPQLPQDVAVNPNAPRPLPLNRQIGGSPTQYAQLQADILEAQRLGARDIRVNQQQTSGAGRVGTNRPDLQYTLPDGTRVYIEYDTTSSPRGVPHARRILANDPNGVVVTKEVN